MHEAGSGGLGAVSIGISEWLFEMALAALVLVVIWGLAKALITAFRG